MNFRYRGVNYTTQSGYLTEYKSDSLINGKYRGAYARFSPSIPLSHQSLINLKYRGVNYSKGSNPYPQPTTTHTRLRSFAV